MKVAIVKYNAGNIRSVDCALRRLGVVPVITDSPEELRAADRVIFPGVGEARTAMEHLRSTGLDGVIKGLTQPVLGICIGMQLMCTHSEEGDTECLGIFDAPVIRFAASRHEDKVPHMGWNDLSGMSSPLFAHLPADPYVYFVHSYYVPVNPLTIAVTDYIQPFSASMRSGNFYATQFHVEKSGSIGEQILSNFLSL